MVVIRDAGVSVGSGMLVGVLLGGGGRVAVLLGSGVAVSATGVVGSTVGVSVGAG